jgi:hypothetical protein
MAACSHPARTGFQAFGPIAYSGGTLSILARPTVELFTWGGPRCFTECPQKDGSRLWLIGSKVVEVQRASANPDLEPLPAARVTLAEPSSSTTSRLKLAIFTADEEGPDPYVIDTGHSIALYAAIENLTIKLLGPDDSTPVPAANPIAPLGPGTVFDARGKVRILGLDHSRDNVWAPLTQTIEVPAGGAGVFTAIPIPRGARMVRALQALNGSYPPDMRWWVGNPAALTAPASFEIGVAAWALLGGSQQQAWADWIVPNASHLVIQQDATVRRFTLVWWIYP